ncbi:MAG: phospholipid carrier-dependent glycosyltransferase [Buchananella hordeovulneris]|nr:phospholipid carrier-dependent glycosyltransferase [Buchananella hordeovulneris]
MNATATKRVGQAASQRRAAKNRPSGLAKRSAAGPLTPSQQREEVFWRTRLGLGAFESTKDRLAAWIIPAAVGVFALILRLVHLAHPQKLVFDETYYVKDAFALMMQGYEGNWDGENANALFESGDFSALSSTGSYVVHPPVGKAMIALGMRLFGAESAFGWRVSGAVAGAVTVLLLAWLVARVLNNATFGLAAGLFLAVDGQHLVLSRTALLDIFLTFWVVVAMCFVFLDRQSMRARLARDLALRAGGKRKDHGIVARTGARWWLVAAGLAFGLACGVKWSGLYMLAVAGLLVAIWDASARQLAGTPKWALQALVRGAIPAFFAMVVLAFFTYLATWWSWLTTDGGYKRGWAAGEIAAGNTPWTPSWLPLPLQDLLDYHKAAYEFHVGVTSEHSYMSKPAGWLLQLRPTSFYWPDDFTHRAGQECPSDRCVEAILAIGNPAIWWLGAAALVVVLYGAFARLDWRAWVVLAGYAGLYLPWFQYSERTIFTFYTVVLSPFVVFALLYAIWLPGHIWKLRQQAYDVAAAELAYEAASPEAGAGRGAAEDAEVASDSGEEGCDEAGAGAGEAGQAAEAADKAPVDKSKAEHDAARAAAAQLEAGTAEVEAEAQSASATWWQSVQRVRAQILATDRSTLVVLGGLTVLVLALAAYFWPIYVGNYIPYDSWHQRMWMESWI